MKIRDPFKLGMHQAFKYWFFLVTRLTEDVEQEVRLVCIQYNPNENLREFDLAINRALYRLARDYGYRKRHISEGKDKNGNQWELCEIQELKGEIK